MVCFHLLHWNPSLGPFLHSQLISHHPPTWAQLLHQRQPCLLIYTALILSPTLQLGDFPLLSHVSLSEGRVSPSPESPLLLPLVSCLFHHRAVWSCPLFLSKQFLLSWGMSPLFLPSSLPLPGKPAVLPSLTLALAGAPWPQCRDLPPLPPFSTSSGALCVPLSQQLTDPHCKRDSSGRARHHAEWAEGRHPQAARRFQPGRDGPQCLGVTWVSCVSLAVKVLGQPEKRFEWHSYCYTFGKVTFGPWISGEQRAQPAHMAPQVLSASRGWLQSHLARGSEMFWQLLWYVLLPARTGSRRVEITEESKPVHLVFLAEAGSGVPEINCVSSIIEGILL